MKEYPKEYLIEHKVTYQMVLLLIFFDLKLL